MGLVLDEFVKQRALNNVLVYLARTKSHELLGDYFNRCKTPHKTTTL
ncbi:hypothetical protein HMPREF1391_00361 [Helicobacter pylori GAM100Ai]|uniref:Uncharacterized protein n=1 Tax=Helicobacter pylori GAM100Ai TaxID=1159019 RepID=A0AB72ZWH3_HELPX|nr:hypothetical protein HMPREF1391_00361 [Helicobacter pylori GAM100Ai]